MLYKAVYAGCLLLCSYAITSCSSLATNNNQISISSNNSLKAHSTIEWKPCSEPEFDDWFDEYASVDKLECTVLKIPVTGTEHILTNENTAIINLAENSEPTVIDLAVSRLPATGNPSQKIGVLINIAGGPGQSGLDVSPINSPELNRLSKKFDIIGYAPRGVTPSQPAVECTPPNSDELVTNIQAYVNDCWKNTPNDLLKTLGANHAVNDLENIRQALNESKINLIGYSYGTKIAMLYAEKYPQHLRAAVLDGVVNINETDFQMSFNQEASVQKSFERFVNHCKSSIPFCYFSDTKSIADAEQKISRLYRKIERYPTRDSKNVTITPSDINWVVYDLLLWSEYWPILNRLFQELQNGNFEMLKYLMVSSEENIGQSTFMAINCADRAPADAERKSYNFEAKRANAQSTWDNYRPQTKLERLDSCYYWPVVGTDKVHIPNLAPSLAPILYVSQTNDPATPYKNALAMQKYTNGVLVTRQGDGHTLALMDSSRCVDKRVVNYLENPASYEKYRNNPPKHSELYCRD